MSTTDKPAGAVIAARRPGRPLVRVWDPVVRLFHWSVVAGVALDYFLLDTGKAAHRYVGYGVAAVLAIRIVWGFVGSVHARFRDFVAPPGVVLGHLADLAGGRERRYVGHNPAGGAMILVLMALLAAIAVTGWMQGLDAFWGVDWVQEAHALAANGLVALAGLHIVAALVESVRHRENLVLAMITGRKRPAGEGDVDHEAAAGRR
ncbi:cytochrome b/b6 domain-containing protein [Zavarzinia sp.]|uniref:cytochrome b/b6 domain-containing protein n=1 Tax=Zavarzinia sp. TaxID=2027920 RepID=UPI00356AE818